jgi:hypothetical protein
VETVGNAPTATILQGSSAPLCCPRGAEGWFRANLPASSAWCFHQISVLGELERPGRIELLVGALATLCSTIELQPHGGKWTESGPLARRDRVYSAATAPACPYGTSCQATSGIDPPATRGIDPGGADAGDSQDEMRWRRGCTGPSRRMRPRGFLTDLPAQMMRRLLTPSLAAGTSAVSRMMKWRMPDVSIRTGARGRSG